MKKCLFIYGNHNVDILFNSHPSKINLHGLWIALKKQLYNNNIDLISREVLGDKSHDFEIHLNAWKNQNSNIPKFAILTENEYIHPSNSNINLLKKYDHIFSWNPDLIKLGFASKIQIAHPLGKGIVDGYKNRDQLLVLFGSNRSFRGWHPKKNLYSERVTSIRWFERYAPNDFALYGKKWNLSGRLPTRLGAIIHSLEKKMPFKRFPFPSWRGEILNKQDVLLKSRFSITYENIQGINGYITEKIFDAFVAGNVPIYWGAPDISNHIPMECFIDRREFSNHRKLYNFIKNMSEQQYMYYQEKIKDFLENNSDEFSCSKFAETISSKIIDVINNKYKYI